MAFFPNMLIFHLLLLILSPPFIHQPQNLAAADNKLIQTLCHNSETPETCMRCVQSDKDSNKANSVGIAIIIVNCINNQGKTLAANMTQMASKSDERLQPIYKGCANDYESAMKELTSAKQDLHKHKYDNAEISVVKALSFDLACHKSVNDHRNEVPGDIFFNMRIYEELSEAACRIIEKLYLGMRPVPKTIVMS